MQDYVLIFASRIRAAFSENQLLVHDKVACLIGGVDRYQPEVLLVRKKRPTWQAGRLNLPGGKIEEGETPLQAAIREFKEETGYSVKAMQPMGRMVDDGCVIHCFAAVSDEFNEPIKPRPQENEYISWDFWMHVREDERLIPNLKVLVPLMLCGVTEFVIEDPLPSNGVKRHSIRLSVPAGK